MDEMIFLGDIPIRVKIKDDGKDTQVSILHGHSSLKLGMKEMRWLEHILRTTMLINGLPAKIKPYK